jgi:heme a synthase
MGSVPGHLTDAVLSPSTASMRRIALAGVVANAGIVMTGAGVRLSESGLGCPDWPRCTASSIVAGGVTGDPLIHRWVEFGNRLVTVAIFVVAVLVFVAAWRYRQDGTRRRDVMWLASLQPAGILAQAILGGIVVLTKLDPVWVSIHFLLSMALVAAAVALYVRCAEGRGPTRLLVPREIRLGAFGTVGVLGLMLAAGTVVTGTGPLAGAGDIPRFHLPLGGVTQFHADIGWLLGGLVIALVVGLRLVSAPRRAVRLGWLLLALIGAQGAIGYAQYFSGLPAGLVWVHVANSVLIWVTALLLLSALRDRGPAAMPGQARAVEAGAAGAPGVQPAAVAPGEPLSQDARLR